MRNIKLDAVDNRSGKVVYNAGIVYNIVALAVQEVEAHKARVLVLLTLQRCLSAVGAHLKFTKAAMPAIEAVIRLPVGSAVATLAVAALVVRARLVHLALVSHGYHLLSGARFHMPPRAPMGGLTCGYAALKVRGRFGAAQRSWC